MHKRALFEGWRNLTSTTQAFDWKPIQGLTLCQIKEKFGGEGGIRTPVTLTGKLDFEIARDRQQTHTVADIPRRKQLSPTLAFANFCEFLRGLLSHFIHSCASGPTDQLLAIKCAVVKLCAH